VVVVNEGFVRLYMKDADPLGRLILLSGKERAIVGVVGDVQQRGAGFFLTGMTRGPLTIPPIVYLPAHQTNDAFLRLVHTWFQPVWSVRARSEAAAAGALREAISRADPLLPVIEVTSMSRQQAAATAQQRLLAVLVGALGGAAVLLAALGIHGLIAQAVAERTRELGIRMALGASAARMVREAALPGVLLASIGALIGGGLSIAGVGLVRSFLWGVSPAGPGDSRRRRARAARRRHDLQRAARAADRAPGSGAHAASIALASARERELPAPGATRQRPLRRLPVHRPRGPDAGARRPHARARADAARRARRASSSMRRRLSLRS
jgi:hypothetical protein